MEVLFHLNDVSLLLLGTACLSAMALQGAHLFVLALWRESPMRVGTLVYEALLMVHLLLASVILREACANYAYVSLWSRSFCVPAIDASWVNVAPVLWGTILALVARRPIMVAELVVMACWLPPFVWLLGCAWPWVVAIGVAFMTSRSLACVALDYRRGGELVTRFSLAEVVNTAQEGILCYKADGRILVMNDAMRGLLETLGCRSVLVDACEVRRILLSDAREIHECMLNANGDVGEAWITAPNSTRWRLVFDVVRLGMGHCGRVIATDVTELMKLNEELEATNAELALVEDHLRASLAVVDATAELDALAHMRARVHDVIGQRLSILHRALEDGDLSRSHLGNLREMVDTIMADLAMREQADPKADLMSVIEAFELIGVGIDVSGSLPDRDEVADAFVRVVREAVTNAVRHARATSVEVRLESTDEGADSGGRDGQHGRRACWSLSICDNGTPLKAAEACGSGIPGMRLAVEEVGGVLYVEPTPTFTVRAVVPRHAFGAVGQAVEEGER